MSEQQENSIICEMRRELLKWFKLNGRRFFWRTHNDTYTVLIVEILLKKTTAGAVDRFLSVFLERFPDIHKLHASSLSDIQNLLTPLGLSKQRSLQLMNLSKVLVESYGGVIPCSKEELLKLPGVGDYTAGAILSFACGLPEAIVDTNIARLVLRLFDIKPSHYEARRSPEVWHKVRELIGKNGKESKRVNWALLDLASAVCKPKNPLHGECPVREWCTFAEKEPINEIPKPIR